MGLTTLVCWSSWLVVLFYLDPTNAGFPGFLLFYLSLFLALLGTFSLVGFFIRAWFSQEEMVYKHIGISLRQGLLFSMLLSVSLLLQGEKLFNWWSALFFILFLAVLESFFLSHKPKGQDKNYER